MGELFYWINEYIKVFVSYGFLMFVWPMVIFRKYLAGKSLTFRFSFCVTGQVVLVNTVVLLLGLLHILNDWTLRILFYGTFLYSIRACFALTPERRNKFKYLINGSFGFKNFLMLTRRKYIRMLETWVKRFWDFYKQNWLEYTLLTVAVVYGMLYFSWGVFHDRSYGFSDMYVHHSWIYQLSEGNPFSAGIYPEGMHCFIYALNGLFGVRIYSCMLLVSAVNVGVILLAAYCLMKELFQWQYSAVFALMFFLTFGDMGRNIILCFARVQCALPQEFAFPAVLLCVLYLIRYLKGGHYITVRGKETKGYWDENLLIFCLAFISTIIVHFYATFMAFFLCVGAVAFLWKNVCTRERFLPLVASVVIGLVIAVTPMVAGYASGIPLQGSLYWAMGVMQQSTEKEDTQPVTSPAETEEMPENGGAVVSGNTSAEDFGEIQEPSDVATVQETSFVDKIIQKLKAIGLRVLELAKNVIRITYNRTYLLLYDKSFVWTLFIIMAAVFVLGGLGAFVYFCIEKKRGYGVKRPAFSGYFIMIFASLVYILAFTSSWIGLPMLVDRSRICFILHLLTVMILMIPADIIFSLVLKKAPVWLLHLLSAGVACGIVAFVCLGGFYHGYLYFELTRYDATVQLTNRIIRDLPQNSFTIVSTTEELYQVIEYGRHEELLEFLEKQEEDIYEIPTEYVFIYVEKRPFRYVQFHFFDGPKWLAYDRYQKMYGITSTCPEYIATYVSDYSAQQEIQYFEKASDSYSKLNSRTIIESKMYQWCERFKELYPNEMKIFYEDEYLVCYYWKQNTQRLYNLVIE